MAEVVPPLFAALALHAEPHFCINIHYISFGSFKSIGHHLLLFLKKFSIFLHFMGGFSRYLLLLFFHLK